MTRSLTLNLGLRYEYVDAPNEVEDRIDYIFNADDNNIEPRLGFAYAPAWDERVARRAVAAARATSRFAAAGASTTAGCSSRSSRRAAPTSGSTRRTRSAATTHDAAEHPQHLGSVARLRVRARSADRPRVADAAGSEISRCRPRPSGTSASIARCRGARRCASATRATTTTSACATRRPTCRCLRSTARSPSSIIPNNAPAGGFPGSARQGRSIAIAADCAVRRHRVLRPRRRPPPARTPCRSPTTRSARACRGPTSGGPIRSTRPTC